MVRRPRTPRTPPLAAPPPPAPRPPRRRHLRQPRPPHPPPPRVALEERRSRRALEEEPRWRRSPRRSPRGRSPCRRGRRHHAPRDGARVRGDALSETFAGTTRYRILYIYIYSRPLPDRRSLRALGGQTRSFSPPLHPPLYTQRGILGDLRRRRAGCPTHRTYTQRGRTNARGAHSHREGAHMHREGAHTHREGAHMHRAEWFFRRETRTHAHSPSGFLSETLVGPTRSAVAYACMRCVYSSTL